MTRLSTLKQSLSVFASVALLLATGCVTVNESSTSDAMDADVFTLENGSSWALHALFLTPADSSDWGPNLLDQGPLLPGDAVSVATVECSMYDVKILDETGGDCVLEGFSLCFGDDGWTISDSDLLVCEVFGEA